MSDRLAEIIAELDAIEPGDPEGSHSEADALLEEAVVALGRQDVVDAYNRVRIREGSWWYA